MKYLQIDNSLIMAIIAINMTVIGLTSLAESKNVIGIDYGKFLMKKFKIAQIKMYYLLIIFALTNVVSLFIMFSGDEKVRLIDFYVLILSLIFAIYYFFRFIIIENKWAVEQIYSNELLGLYCSSNDTEHFEIDKMVGMLPGTRTNRKLSTNVILYFNTFNADTQLAFYQVFGPKALLYSKKKRIAKFREREFGIIGYPYRVSDGGIVEISFEFFQMFRYSEIQDKWALDILLAVNGDADNYVQYDEYRLYNLARMISQIKVFGNSDNIFTYKFIFYLSKFIYATVDISKYHNSDVNKRRKLHDIEIYMMNMFIEYLVSTVKNKNDEEFIKMVNQIFEDIFLKDKYNGFVSKAEIAAIIAKDAIRYDNDVMKHMLERIMDDYQHEEHSSRTGIDLNALRREIEAEKRENNNITVNRVQLF